MQKVRVTESYAILLYYEFLLEFVSACFCSRMNKQARSPGKERRGRVSSDHHPQNGQIQHAHKIVHA